MKSPKLQPIIVCLLGILVAVGFISFTAPTNALAQNASEPRTLQKASSTDQSVLSPQFLIVPKISAATAVESVGETDEGKMETPDNWRNSGWYEPGVKPGENGHAVFAAHRDWDGNAGPFYELPELSAGDNVFVAGTDAIHIYTVTESNSFSRTADPASAIFEGDDKPKITLIGCEGDFVDSAGTYDQRRVVQAELTYTFQ